MRRFGYNPRRIYVLSVFFKDGGVESEWFYSLKELLIALQEWEQELDFQSAHLSIED